MAHHTYLMKKKESVLSNEEKNLGFAMGARVAKIASKLS